MVRLVRAIDRILVKSEEVLLAALLVAMVLLASLQVLLRNFFDAGIAWADNSLQHATIVVGLLGAAIATSEGRHLNIDLVQRLVPPVLRSSLQVLIGISAIIVCVALAHGGLATCLATYQPWRAAVPQGWSVGRLFSSQFHEGGFPAWVLHLILTGGFALIGLQFLLRLINDVAALSRGAALVSKGEALRDDAYLDQLAKETSAPADGGVSDKSC